MHTFQIASLAKGPATRDSEGAEGPTNNSQAALDDSGRTEGPTNNNQEASLLRDQASLETGSLSADSLCDDILAESPMDRVLASLPFDPFAIYCSVTGAPIGQLSDSESMALWDVAWDRCAGDETRIADELRLACFAFARPSPSFGIMSKSALQRLAERVPMQIWAYLVNRWLDDPLAKRVDFQERIKMTEQRVLAWPMLAQNAEAWNSEIGRLCLLQLLQIDTFSNLVAMTPPDVHLRSFLTGAPSEALKAKLESINDKLHETARKTNNLPDGNRVSAPLYRQMFTNLTPTKAELKRQEDAAKMQDFMGILIASVSAASPGASANGASPPRSLSNTNKYDSEGASPPPTVKNNNPAYDSNSASPVLRNQPLLRNQPPASRPEARPVKAIVRKGLVIKLPSPAAQQPKQKD